MKSIVKNIFTTIVALTVLIGATGFQIYQHTCTAHNYSTVSLIETPVCEMDNQVNAETDDCCKEEVEKIDEPSCCKSNPIDEDNPVTITSKENECCITSVESNQLQDIIISAAEKKNSTLEIFSALVPSIENDIQKTEQNLIIRNNDLPPPKFGKRLLQTIHQLKIDSLIS